MTDQEREVNELRDEIDRLKVRVRTDQEWRRGLQNTMSLMQTTINTQSRAVTEISAENDRLRARISELELLGNA